MDGRQLTRITPTDMELTVDPGMRWGEMPREDLMAKFEETYTGERPADLVSHFIRGEIMDRRYDKPLFEDEAPRGRVNQPAGYLELIHNGHRGAEEVERPEQFLGIGGYEEIDPRGVAQDPNMELMKDQAAARMRFVNWKPDSNESVTGLGRSESQVIADNLKVRQWWRKNLVIFDRQLDGKQNGLRRTYEHRSAVEKQEQDKTYGDKIKDYALTPQRKANVHKTNKNPLDFADDAFDQDLKYAVYGQACRKQQRVGPHNHAASEVDRQVDNAEDKTPTFRQVAQSVKCVVRARKELQAAQQHNTVDVQAAKESISFKQRAQSDISRTLREQHMNHSVLPALSDMMARATPNMIERAHGVRTVDNDSVTAPHHFLNAEIIRKAAAAGDMSVVKRSIQRDAEVLNSPQEADERARRVAKAASRQQGDNRGLVVSDRVADETYQTKSYRNRGIERARLGTNADTQHMVSQEDSTRTRKTQLGLPGVVDQTLFAQGAVFGENQYKDRKLGGMGQKYTWHLGDREGQDRVDVRGA